jgi:hypothetical protein
MIVSSSSQTTFAAPSVARRRTMMRRDADKLERERAARSRLLRAWHVHHRDQRKAVLAGVHGPMFERLLAILKELPQSQATLLAFVRGIPWPTIDEDARYVALHEIGRAIVSLRERQGLPPFSDPLPGERENVSRLIKQTMFPANAAPTGAEPGRTRMNTEHEHEEST